MTRICCMPECNNCPPQHNLFSAPNKKFCIKKKEAWAELLEIKILSYREDKFIQELYSKDQVKICEEHFLEEDIITKGIRKELRIGAIPTLKLPQKYVEVKHFPERRQDNLLTSRVKYNKKMPVCTAYNCKANLKTCSLFKFPKKHGLCQEWLECLGRVDLYEFTYRDLKNGGFRVCQSHFKPSDIYTKDGKKYVVKYAKPVLQKSATPEEFLLRTKHKYIQKPDTTKKKTQSKTRTKETSLQAPANEGSYTSVYRHVKVDNSPLEEVELIYYCSVPMCGNNSQKNPDLGFYQIPASHYTKEKRFHEKWKRWLTDIFSLWNVDKSVITSTTRICSIHFEDTCFNFKPGTKMHSQAKLKADSCPTFDPLYSGYIKAQERLFYYRLKQISAKETNLSQIQQNLQIRQENIVPAAQTSNGSSASNTSTIIAKSIQDSDFEKITEAVNKDGKSIFFVPLQSASSNTTTDTVACNNSAPETSAQLSDHLFTNNFPSSQTGESKRFLEMPNYGDGQWNALSIVSLKRKGPESEDNISTGGSAQNNPLNEDGCFSHKKHAPNPFGAIDIGIAFDDELNKLHGGNQVL
ncbi:uncharacterized protein LOC143446549 isoform X2 [Clavelina lepadiformis]|uniref:uncharacterized protein LOC143446549 isoform X2 n=1 Tax=Clavelina lepadiformis TaxID=159417 RepID=UPI004042339E